ncbi:MAG: PIN domain-containing protein, partial [Anaerolineales bacterium]|nr:PIN domain-containing protein [Anaerolineales bacterium]
KIANTLVKTLWENRLGCLSTQVLQEFYVTVTRKIPVPLPYQEASDIVAELGKWTLHLIAVQDITKAIDLQNKYRISFWDALILSSASRLGCHMLLTEDLNHGQSYDGVIAINPFVNHE